MSDTATPRQTIATPPVAWVRDAMIPPAPPPTRQGGTVNWLRENLFSGPANISMTIIGLIAIWALFAQFWPWFAHSVWRADSLNECRAIIAETWGEGSTGACWAVIRARWYQWIYGFYPPALWWRPILAFGLLLIALIPVLFAEQRRLRMILWAIVAVFTVASLHYAHAPDAPIIVTLVVLAVAAALLWLRPRVMLIFSLCFPLLAYWLLWGGPVWWTIAVALGFVVGGMAGLLVSRIAPLLGVVAGFVAAVLWWFYANDVFADAMNGLIPFGLQRVSSDLFGGFLLSTVIGVSGIAMSLPIGIVLALARRSDMPVVKAFAVMFIEFIRGVPLITLLFVASLLLNYFMPRGTNFDKILRVVIMVTLFASAYMAEVIRGGLAALPKGQYEAADSLGLTYWQAQRLIILPQALKIAIPAIVSTFIGVFKDTTLVAFISLYDPLKGVSDIVRQDMAWKGIYWEPYLFAGAIFFIVCFAMSRYSMYLETRLKRDHH
ncbi:MAG: amino acid ABC transporter permease [Paracoccus sp. (in: a-proteobacteria)]|nr:amino acid ABC transporter permease [Paracoccus sp. (in: a-proteobacteria)]